MSETIRVLAAPAHYQLNTTSEYGWTTNILYETARLFPVEFQAITGFHALKDSLTHPRVTVWETFSQLKTKPDNKDRLIFLWRYLQKSKRILKREKIDIVHHILPFGWQETFNPIALFGLTGNIPFVIGPVQMPHTFIGSDDPEGTSRSLLSSMFRYLNKKTLKKATTIIAINNASKNIYQAYIPEATIKVIPPGIHANNYRAMPARDADNLRLLSVGALILRKDFATLIKAMEIVVKKFPRARLDILGQGPQETAIKNHIQKTGLQNHVTLHGHIPHQATRTFFENMDIFCLASRSETFGQVYVEAMASGKPIVSTNNAGASEIIENDRTGYLVSIEDADALATKIIDIQEHPEKKISFGMEGRARVEKVYDWKKIAPQYFGIYEEMKSRHTKGYSV